MLSNTNDIVRALKRQYMKEWRSKNKDKIRAYNQKYWERKAKALSDEEKTNVQKSN